MNRKILGAIIVLVLIIGALPSSNSEKNNQGFSKENLEDNENVINYQIKGSYYFQDYPVMEDPISYPDIEGVPYPILDDLPDEFSWRNYNGKDWTTPAKNQGSCGSCWAFAALGVLESMVKIREGNADINPDFSEQYVLSCLPEAGSCRGGRAWVALELLQDDTPRRNNENC